MRREDPMLESEIIRTLIVNEMADNGRVIVNAMVDGMKVWDAEVSCNAMVGTTGTAATLTGTRFLIQD